MLCLEVTTSDVDAGLIEQTVELRRIERQGFRVTDRKSLLALRGVGPESEAGSVRFHERRVTRVGPEVKHGRRRAGGCVDQSGLFSSACREISS